MPKRRSGDRDGFRASKRRRRHLYLVFDDWLWGYSIRKVNLSSSPSPSGSSDPNDGDGADSPKNAFPAEHLMPPAVFRVEAQRGFPQHFTAAASGSKIIAVLSMRIGFEYRPSAPSASIPIFDLRRRAFTLGPRPEVDLVTPIFIPAGGRVFALSADSFQFQALEPGSGRRCGREGQWRKLQMHPSFKREFSVSSYALHRDGRTIFVSTASGGTFTFDTAAEDDSNWTEHGRWKLPFAGRAHFDPDLDAWIGLSRRKRTKGHLCACDAPRPDDGGERRPGWKVGKEKLFSEDPAEKHVGATLVYMGGGQSEFCLVQCVSREDGCPPGDPLNVCRPCRYVCRLTTFSVRLGEEDGLPTVGDSRRVRCYKVPETTSGFTLGQPVAFWM